MWLKSVALKIEKGIHTASQKLCWLSMIILFLMMLFITTDVFGRYLFKSPITGSIDFITVMMVILVFPSLAYVTSEKGHVRTDILYDRFPKRGQGGVDIINSLFSIILVVLITWQLGARAWSFIQHPPGISTNYFQWPHLPFICLASAGCALMSLELILWLFHSVNRALGREK
jgi:TRAP-type C4-dicarboxylate transport system permease small subunit